MRPLERALSWCGGTAEAIKANAVQEQEECGSWRKGKTYQRTEMNDDGTATFSKWTICGASGLPADLPVKNTRIGVAFYNAQISGMLSHIFKLLPS